MSSINCVINFDNNPMQVFYSGQSMQGIIRLAHAEEKIVCSAYIQLNGMVYETKNRMNPNSVNFYDGKIYFINTSNGRELRLSPGPHEWRVSWCLPSRLPTSIEGGYGCIKYIMSVYVNVLNGPKELILKEPFTVIKSRNLRAEQALWESVYETKSFYPPVHPILCFCRSIEPLIIAAEIPVGGYTPGQVINLKVTVTNVTNRPVSVVTVQLIKKLTYNVNHSKRKEIIVLKKVDTTGCEVHQNKVIRVNILVPSTPPSSSSNDNFIIVRYCIRIIAVSSSIFKNPVIEVPVVIGTYPIADDSHLLISGHLNNILNELTSNSLISEQTDPNSLIHSASEEEPSAPPLYEEEDPPTYEQAVMTDPNGNEFLPKYPMYRRKTSYSNGDEEEQ